MSITESRVGVVRARRPRTRPAARRSNTTTTRPARGLTTVRAVRLARRRRSAHPDRATDRGRSRSMTVGVRHADAARTVTATRDRVGHSDAKTGGCAGPARRDVVAGDAGARASAQPSDNRPGKRRSRRACSGLSAATAAPAGSSAVAQRQESHPGGRGPNSARGKRAPLAVHGAGSVCTKARAGERELAPASGTTARPARTVAAARSSSRRRSARRRAARSAPPSAQRGDRCGSPASPERVVAIGD